MGGTVRTFWLDRDTSALLDSKVPNGERSQFVKDAIQSALKSKGPRES